MAMERGPGLDGLMEEVVEGRFGGDFFAVNGDGDLSAQKRRRI